MSNNLNFVNVQSVRWKLTHYLLSGFALMTWFVVHDSRWNFHEPYFGWKKKTTANHIERTKHKIMVLKPANKCQILQLCHNSSIIYTPKVL